MTLLVLNAGSSSLKYGLFDDGAREQLTAGNIEGTDYEAAVSQVLAKVAGSNAIVAVGHRVVQGGRHFRESVRVTRAVKETLKELIELAPLHNPPAIATIHAAEKALPLVPHVAVFDTAFYHDMPPSQYIYPAPYEWYSHWGMRRFGFHGISYAYCLEKAAELLGKKPKELDIVACHLGNGCSATAIHNGVALATTMGMTPLEGLMMGTRAGSIDPGILLFIERHKGLSAVQLEDILNHESGLLGTSGVSSDYREVAKAAERGQERARLALEIYANRIRAAIGALAVTLGRMDALLFTAGVGENAALLRADVCRGLETLGIRLDAKKNDASAPDSDIAAKDSTSRILIIHTCEEWMIARETHRVVSAA